MLRKRVALLERRPDWSFVAFDRHWATDHAEIITTLPGLSEYVQNVVLDIWSQGPAPRVDGVVEVWFDDTVVSSPEEHTSLAQQEDEVSFLRSLTAITLDERRSYDAEHKIWVLAPTPLPVAVLAELPHGAFHGVPDDDAVPMQRPRLKRESNPPQSFITVPTTARESASLFAAAVASLRSADAPPGIRVLRTRTRRIR